MQTPIPVGELARVGRQAILVSILTNIALAAVKIGAGILGNSYALIADGVESSLDVLSSGLIWGALKFAERPPDASHPYGHGKIESLAAVTGALFLLGAGFAVALQSAISIHASYFRLPTEADVPKVFTLLVLLGVIFSKEVLFQFLKQRGSQIGSTAIEADAWHHRSDAITSLAAFIGISIALIGGPKWAVADDWAALFSCGVIVFNGLRMLRTSVGEVLDEQRSTETIEKILAETCEVSGVSSAEKCRVRKSGLTLLVDLHVRVDGERTVNEGHEISHQVKDRLIHAGLRITDITVHIEPEPVICRVPRVESV